MKATEQEVQEALKSELIYQRRLWNRESEGVLPHTPTEWLVYIDCYLTEAKKLSTMNPDSVADVLVLAQIRKMGAMCITAMEQNGAPSRE